MEKVQPNKHAGKMEQTWAVHRQDDNGNCFVVETGLSREEAECLAAEFQARGHKQLNWAEPNQN